MTDQLDDIDAMSTDITDEVLEEMGIVGKPERMAHSTSEGITDVDVVNSEEAASSLLVVNPPDVDSMERMVIENYLSGMDPLQAVVMAGYKGDPIRTWKSLRANNSFCRGLVESMEKHRISSPYKPSDVEACLWKEATATNTSASARNAALRELSRIYKLADKQESGGTLVSVTIDLSGSVGD